MGLAQGSGGWGGGFNWPDREHSNHSMEGHFGLCQVKGSSTFLLLYFLMTSLCPPYRQGIIGPEKDLTWLRARSYQLSPRGSDRTAIVPEG